MHGKAPGVAGELVESLCRRYGIAPEYTDIWGRTHGVPEESRAALLGAMGVDTRSEPAMRAALAQAEHRAWPRVVPPVTVVRARAGPPEIELTLPVAQLDAPWRWVLTEESGRQRSGPVEVSALVMGEQRDVDGELRQRAVFTLPVSPEIGYHGLELDGPDGAFATTLIVAPETCYRPEAVADEGRVWGLSVQLYAVRSRRNWGVGDFTDLTRMLELAAREGAGLVGVNPLHALFPHDPERASPYGPSNRLFLNVLYIDVEAVPDLAECDEARALIQSSEFQAQLRALRAAELVDYKQVAALKTSVLERLYAHFRDHHLGRSRRGAAFREFQSERGRQLRRHALYEALQERLQSEDASAWGWPVWPEAYRDPGSAAVAAFAEANVERIELFEYLQWQAELQLDAAGRRAYELGLGIGIYEDLAVGVDLGGSEAWANQALYAFDASIGTPPDDFNLNGQDWGLPPWIPDRLRDAAYAPFITTLRRNMRAAGALRIDHVMALLRLFWTPKSGTPADGAYVSYPFEDLLGILALESRRNRCLVIGEDLGTVPDEVRSALQAIGVLSYRLLYFEKRDDGAFRAPDEYVPDALVAASTHDLPTLTGFWTGNDLEWRRRLGLFPSETDYEEQVVQRAEDRMRLLLALAHEGLLPEGADVSVMSTHEMTSELIRAVHAFLARTPARVLLVQPEDLLGQIEQANVPGTVDEHPNWRRKLGLEIELWAEEPRVASVLAELRDVRGTAVLPPTLPVPESSVPSRARIPTATYRLQFNKDFTLDDAAELVPYLHALGISHCYASPLIKARSGSAHGYDIVDHGSLNPELGGREAFDRFSDALAAHGLGLILDIVPNHMGVMGRDNPWWLDVLENGPASRFASFFDIDWNPFKEELRGKVLLPVLDDHYGNALDRGELALAFEPGTGVFSVEYFEHRFPLDPREYPRIFAQRGAQLADRLGAEDPRVLEFESLMTALGNLPPREDAGEAAVAERARDKEIHKARLATLYADEADIAAFVDDALRDFNGAEDFPADPSLFHELLEAQAWRLAFWRVASDQINYRRFFDINDLAALRMESADVFDATHRLVFELIGAGRVHGLRIDHPDGLFDPARYFEMVQESVAALARMGVGDSGVSPERTPLYVVAEKILAADEVLPANWLVHGTTGYDFARVCAGLFVAPDAEPAFDRAYRECAGERPSFPDTEFRSKRLIMQEALASELTVLATELARIAELDIHTRDFTGTGLRQALETTVACFPVYRTYVSDEGASASDEAYLEQALTTARREFVAADTNIFDFLRDVLLMRQAQGREEDYRARVSRFAMKVQQFTSPVAAKGSEDTAFYRHHRLVSLNEVGGDPGRFGNSVEEFHAASRHRLEHWPHSMLCTSTHDSKRSEDVRVRIHALTELAREWRELVGRWMQINAAHRRQLEAGPAPAANDEYLLYQTLVGIWPPEPAAVRGIVARVKSYMLKAAREAKERTSWVSPRPEYEQALEAFVGDVLAPQSAQQFVRELTAFVERVARVGMVNSLSQLLLKLTAPGVPDIYQGNELWDLSLVDPDNRRPVDYGTRRSLLDELQHAFASGRAGPGAADALHGLCAAMPDGRIKMHVTWRCLTWRRSVPELFRHGAYIPLRARGEGAGQLCAFARQHEGAVALVVVPRLAAARIDTRGGPPFRDGAWGDTDVELPPGLGNHEYTNVLTGETLSVERTDGTSVLRASALLEPFPVALLSAEPARRAGA